MTEKFCCKDPISFQVCFPNLMHFNYVTITEEGISYLCLLPAKRNPSVTCRTYFSSLHSSLSKDVLFKLLSVSESSVVVSFLEIVSGVSENKQFKTLHPTLALNIINDAQELSLVYQNKAHSLGVDEMERIGNCVLEILKTNVSDVVGVFFLQCLDHIAEELYKETNYTMPNVLIPQSTPASVSTNKKSSTVLLECEQNLGVESYNNTLVLYIIAALCEHMSNDVLNGADLRSLLLTISTIVGCHSHYFTQSSKKQEKMFQITGPSLESLLGGPITLSISFGLLSAILGGAREVSSNP